jgi:hypothetical protein
MYTSGMKTFDTRTAVKPKQFGLHDSALKSNASSYQRPNSAYNGRFGSKTPQKHSNKAKIDILGLMSPNQEP